MPTIGNTPLKELVRIGEYVLTQEAVRNGKKLLPFRTLVNQLQGGLKNASHLDRYAAKGQTHTRAGLEALYQKMSPLRAFIEAVILKIKIFLGWFEPLAANLAPIQQLLRDLGQAVEKTVNQVKQQASEFKKTLETVTEKAKQGLEELQNSLSPKSEPISESWVIPGEETLPRHSKAPSVEAPQSETNRPPVSQRSSFPPVHSTSGQNPFNLSNTVPLTEPVQPTIHAPGEIKPPPAKQPVPPTNKTPQPAVTDSLQSSTQIKATEEKLVKTQELETVKQQYEAELAELKTRHQNELSTLNEQEKTALENQRKELLERTAEVEKRELALKTEEDALQKRGLALNKQATELAEQETKLQTEKGKIDQERQQLDLEKAAHQAETVKLQADRAKLESDQLLLEQQQQALQRDIAAYKTFSEEVEAAQGRLEKSQQQFALDRQALEDAKALVETEKREVTQDRLKVQQAEIALQQKQTAFEASEAKLKTNTDEYNILKDKLEQDQKILLQDQEVVKTAQAQVDQKTLELSEKEARLAERDVKLEAAETAFNQRSDDLKEQIALYDKTVEQFKQAQVTHQVAVEALETEKQALLTTKAEAENTLKKANEAQQALETDKAQWETQRLAKAAQLGQQREKLTEALRQRFENLRIQQADLKTQTEQLQSLLKEHPELEDKVQTARTQLETLNQQLESAEQTLKIANSQLTEAQARIPLAEWEKTLNQQGESLTKREEALKKLEKAIEEATEKEDARIDSENADIADKSERLNKQQEQLENERQAFFKDKTNYEELQSTLKSANTTIEELTRGQIELNKTIDQLNQDLAKAPQPATSSFTLLSNAKQSSGIALPDPSAILNTSLVTQGHTVPNITFPADLPKTKTGSFTHTSQPNTVTHSEQAIHITAPQKPVVSAGESFTLGQTSSTVSDPRTVHNMVMDDLQERLKAAKENPVQGAIEQANLEQEKKALERKLEVQQSKNKKLNKRLKTAKKKLLKQPAKATDLSPSHGAGSAVTERHMVDNNASNLDSQNTAYLIQQNQKNQPLTENLEQIDPVIPDANATIQPSYTSNWVDGKSDFGSDLTVEQLAVNIQQIESLKTGTHQKLPTTTVRNTALAGELQNLKDQKKQLEGLKEVVRGENLEHKVKSSILGWMESKIAELEKLIKEQDDAEAIVDLAKQDLMAMVEILLKKWPPIEAEIAKLEPDLEKLRQRYKWPRDMEERVANSVQVVFTEEEKKLPQVFRDRKLEARKMAVKLEALDVEAKLKTSRAKHGILESSLTSAEKQGIDAHIEALVQKEVSKLGKIPPEYLEFLRLQKRNELEARWAKVAWQIEGQEGNVKRLADSLGIDPETLETCRKQAEASARQRVEGWTQDNELYELMTSLRENNGSINSLNHDLIRAKGKNYDLSCVLAKAKQNLRENTAAKEVAEEQIAEWQAHLNQVQTQLEALGDVHLEHDVDLPQAEDIILQTKGDIEVDADVQFYLSDLGAFKMPVEETDVPLVDQVKRVRQHLATVTRNLEAQIQKKQAAEHAISALETQVVDLDRQLVDSQELSDTLYESLVKVTEQVLRSKYPDEAERQLVTEGLKSYLTKEFKLLRDQTVPFKPFSEKEKALHVVLETGKILEKDENKSLHKLKLVSKVQLKEAPPLTQQQLEIIKNDPEVGEYGLTGEVMAQWLEKLEKMAEKLPTMSIRDIINNTFFKGNTAALGLKPIKQIHFNWAWLTEEEMKSHTDRFINQVKQELAQIVGASVEETDAQKIKTLEKYINALGHNGYIITEQCRPVICYLGDQEHLAIKGVESDRLRWVLQKFKLKVWQAWRLQNKVGEPLQMMLAEVQRRKAMPNVLDDPQKLLLRLEDREYLKKVIKDRKTAELQKQLQEGTQRSNSQPKQNDKASVGQEHRPIGDIPSPNTGRMMGFLKLVEEEGTKSSKVLNQIAVMLPLSDEQSNLMGILSREGKSDKGLLAKQKLQSFFVDTWRPKYEEWSKVLQRLGERKNEFGQAVYRPDLVKALEDLLEERYSLVSWHFPELLLQSASSKKAGPLNGGHLPTSVSAPISSNVLTPSASDPIQQKLQGWCAEIKNDPSVQIEFFVLDLTEPNMTQAKVDALQKELNDQYTLYASKILEIPKKSTISSEEQALLATALTKLVNKKDELSARLKHIPVVPTV